MEDRKRRHDPEPSEIEVDEANELSGGPRTDSLSAGLSSDLRRKDEAGNEDSVPERRQD